MSRLPNTCGEAINRLLAFEWGGNRHLRPACNNGGNRSALGRLLRQAPPLEQLGAAPVYRGEPGYGPHLDRDIDGVGCE